MLKPVELFLDVMNFKQVRRQSLLAAIVAGSALTLAGCSDSSGSSGGNSGGSISLDEGQVYPMMEQLRYEILPSGGVEGSDTIERWTWDVAPFRSGALSECASMAEFNSSLAANSLEEACSVAARCNFTFDQSQAAADDGSTVARFVVEVPILRAPVGLSYQLQGLNSRAETIVTNATFCLVPINEEPVAAADSFTIVQGETFQIDGNSPIHLLSNDADDIDNSNQALSVSTTPRVPPQLATQFSLRADGGFSYLYSGDLSVQGSDRVVDSFTYEISDGLNISTAEVRLTVVNRDNPPVQSGDIPTIVVFAGIFDQFDLSGNFSDPEGSQLQFAAVPETLPPSSDFALSVLGIFGGTASANDIGNHTITITVGDAASSINANFLLTVLENEPPVVSQVEDRFVDFGELVNIDMSQSFSDPEGRAELVYTLSSQPASGLVINPASGLITGNLPATGTYQITVNASDGFNPPVSTTFSLSQGERPNRAPLFAGEISNQGVTVGEAIDPVSGDFSDLDNDALSYNISSVPPGLSFNSDTGVLSGTAQQIGVYSLTITASDADGASSNSNQFSVTVTALPNNPPVLNASVGNQVGTVGVAINSFSANFSDPEGEPLSYSVNGLPDGVGIDAATGIVTGTPTVTGTFQVVITAEDSAGDSIQSNSFTLTVSPPENSVPVFNNTLGDQSVVVGAFLQPISGDFTDSDGDVLTYSSTALPSNVSIDSGTGVISGNPSVVGTTSVVITATDPSGDSADSNSFDIIVSSIPNNDPTFSGPIPSQTAITGQQITAFSIAGFFADIDADDTLTFSESSSNGLPDGLSLSTSGQISGIPTATAISTVVIVATDSTGSSVPSTPFTYTVSSANVAPDIDSRTPSGVVSVVFGGSETINITVVDESVSTLTFQSISSDSNVVSVVAISDTEYSITAEAIGSATITITVTDDQGLPDTEVISVTVSALPNIAPVIDSRAPSGDPLTVASGAQQSVAILVTDENVGSLVYTASSADPSVATVTVGAGGNYTIEGVAANTTAITLTVTDEGGLSDMVTFDVTVPAINQPPIVTGRSPAGDPLTEIGIADTDPVNITVSDESPTTLVYTIESSDENIATVSSEGGGDFFVMGQAEGTATITITVTDDQGLSTTEIFDVAVPAAPNGAPEVIGSIDDLLLPQGQTLAAGIDVAALFTDPDGDVMTFATSPLPAGLGFDPATNLITGTPTVAGAVDVTVTATDVSGSNLTVGADPFEILVNGGPTVATGNLDQNLDEGVAASLDISVFFSDPEGDSLSFVEDQLPTGLILDQATGLITGTPTVAGPLTVTITATDTAVSGLSADAVFDLDIVPPAAPPNAGPSASSGIAVQMLEQDLNATLDIASFFLDPENDPLTFVADQLPTDLTLDAATGIISGTPSVVETVSVMVTATDVGASGLSAVASFDIEITPTTILANAPPVFEGPIPDQTFALGMDIGSFDISGFYTDNEGDALDFSYDQLPDGLDMDGSTGIISGVPTTIESVPVEVAAIDTLGSGTLVVATAFLIEIE